MGETRFGVRVKGKTANGQESVREATQLCLCLCLCPISVHKLLGASPTSLIVGNPGSVGSYVFTLSGRLQQGCAAGVCVCV